MLLGSLACRTPQGPRMPWPFPLLSSKPSPGPCKTSVATPLPAVCAELQGWREESVHEVSFEVSTYYEVVVPSSTGRKGDLRAQLGSPHEGES